MKKMIIYCMAILMLTVLCKIGFSEDLLGKLRHYKNSIKKSGYVRPTDEQLEALRMGVWHMTQSEFAGAEIQAQKLNYGLESMIDETSRSDTATYYFFEPRDTHHSPWGLYVFYLEDDANDVVVEVPFPKDEFNTVEMAGITFMESKAKALLIAGCSKSMCNVVTEQNNPFLIAHKEVTDMDTYVIQYQTFDNKEYPSVVMSGGIPSGNVLIDEIMAEIMDVFDVGIYDGIFYKNISQEDNLEAQYTNDIGADFAGILLNTNVYNSKSRAELLATEIGDALNEATDSDTST